MKHKFGIIFIIVGLLSGCAPIDSQLRQGKNLIGITTYMYNATDYGSVPEFSLDNPKFLSILFESKEQTLGIEKLDEKFYDVNFDVTTNDGEVSVKLELSLIVDPTGDLVFTLYKVYQDQNGKYSLTRLSDNFHASAGFSFLMNTTTRINNQNVNFNFKQNFKSNSKSETLTFYEYSSENVLIAKKENHALDTYEMTSDTLIIETTKYDTFDTPYTTMKVYSKEAIIESPTPVTYTYFTFKDSRIASPKTLLITHISNDESD